MPDAYDRHQWREDAARSYNEALRQIRLKGIRNGDFLPDWCDPEEVDAWKESGVAAQPVDD